jgi:hypothetical protein
MPVNVQCPRCNKELAAPDELIGKVAACPRCNTQFPVTVNIRGSAPSMLAGPVTPAATNSPVPANPRNSAGSNPTASANPRSSGSAGSRTVDSADLAYMVPPNGSGSSPPQGSAPPAVSTAIPTNLPPSSGSRSPSAAEEIRRSHSIFSPPVPAGTAPPSAAAPSAGPTTQPVTGSGMFAAISASSAATAASSAPALVSPPTEMPSSSATVGKLSTSSVTLSKTISRSAPAAPREAQPARFIAAESADTRINLGADGRLPELVLHEASKQDASESAERTSHPIRLLAIIGVSFVALIWVLTMDVGSSRNESQSKADQRQELQDLYARRSQPHHPQKEYQALLSKALQAHNQGKYADEQRYYRLVLNLLRDEALQKDAANVKGLTGVRKGDKPSDEHLESLLSRLLSKH